MKQIESLPYLVLINPSPKPLSASDFFMAIASALVAKYRWAY